MRIASAFLTAVIVSSAAHAGGTVTKFEGVQEHCVQVGGIKFGANSRWTDCQVTKGRWFATLGIIDMYQAQYCLSKGDQECGQRALLVFGNRAYTPKATVMLQHIDPGATEYDDPVLVQTQYGDILTLAARIPGGSETKRYYLWRAGNWVAIDAHSWRREVSKKLPKGTSVMADAWPDADSMSAQMKLDGADDRLIKVDFGLAGNRFVVKKLELAQKEPGLALAQHEAQ